MRCVRRAVKSRRSMNVKLQIFRRYTTITKYTKIVNFAKRDLGVGLKRFKV